MFSNFNFNCGDLHSYPLCQEEWALPQYSVSWTREQCAKKSWHVYSVLWTREQSWIAKFQQGRRGRNEPPTLENISPIVSIFFCETNANSPFSSGWQWQALGTDIHSKVINLLVVINIFQTLPASCVSFIKSLCAPQPDTESCSCWFTSFNFGIINN